MSVIIKLLRGTTAQNDAYTGAEGVVTIDLTTKELRLHDGITAGGHVIPNVAAISGLQDSIDNLGIADIDGLQDALDGKVNTSLVGANDGIAELDANGKLKTSQLPDLAITDFLGEVADETAMLALTGQRGDWTVRSDTGTVFILIADDASVIGSWREMTYPISAVTSVNSRTGAVVITAEDVGLDNVDNFATASEAEARAGTANDRFMTPLRTTQLLDEMGIVEDGGDTVIDAGTF